MTGKPRTRYRESAVMLPDQTRFLDALLATVTDVIWTTDIDNRLLYINPATQQLYGHKRDVFLARPSMWLECVHPNDRVRASEEALRLLDQNTVDIEYRIVRADGEIRRARDRRTVVRTDTGEPYRFAGVVTDITTSRRTEGELAESVSLLRATLDSIFDGLLVVDRGGKIVSFNQRFVGMWRIPKGIVERGDDDEAVRFVLDQLKDPDAFVDKVRYLYSRPDEESFDILTFKDGRVFERYSQPQRLGDEIVGRVWSFRDVTERRVTEDQLRQAQKMESVGRLAGGIAHDFNNLLVPIIGCAEMALLRLDDMKHSAESIGIRKEIEEIRKAATQAADLTRQILAFGRKQVLDMKLLDLNALITEMQNMLRHLASDRVQVQIEVDTPPAPVVGDRSQIERIIVNLAANARDAMPDGGTMTITVAAATLTDKEAPSGLSAGEYVTLRVADTGDGIAESARERMFEPFFTTKSTAKGTGLGLATVHGIVQQHRGAIIARNAPSHGAVFDVYFPRADIPRPDKQDPIARRSRPGKEVILVVEDDEMVCRMAREMLERKGYEVLSANNSEDAIALVEQRDGDIDLLLTDVVMPGMNGRELASTLRKSMSNLRVLFMSGYADDTGFGSMDQWSEFLQKPFSMESLSAKLKALLG